MLSPFVWRLIRPHVLSREIWFDIDASTVGAVWSLDWANASTGMRNGVWLDLAELGPSPYWIEIRPSGRPAAGATPEPSFHLYEVRAGTDVVYSRDQLKALLASFRANPATSRERGLVFAGDWIAGIESSGIIFQGSSPGMLLLPLPASVATREVVLISERTPTGAPVEFRFEGSTLQADTHSEAWSHMMVSVSRATRDTPPNARVRVRLPSYPIRDLRLQCHAGPFGPSTISRPVVGTRAFGVVLPTEPIAMPAFAATMPRGLTPEGRYWVGEEELRKSVLLATHLYPTLATDAFGWACVLAGMALLVAVAMGAVRLAPGLDRTLLRTLGPARHSARAMSARQRWVSVVALAGVAIVNAWVASWAPVLILADSVDYIANAHLLVFEGSWSQFNAWRLPGLSLLLAPFIAWSSSPEAVFAGVQACAVVLSSIFAWDIARRVIGPAWGVVAMMLVGLDPVTMGWTRHILSESSSLLFFTAAAWAVVRAGGIAPAGVGAGVRAACFAAIFGVCAGVGVLMRGNAQVVALFGVVGLVLMLRSRGWRLGAFTTPAIGAGVCALVVLAWVLRVHEVYGRYATIIGRNYSRIVFGARQGLIDPNQTAAFSPAAWLALRAAPPVDEYALINAISTTGRWSNAAGADHPWIVQETACGVIADESRRRDSWPSTIHAVKCGLNHLRVWRDPSIPYFRSADAVLGPLKGELLVGQPTNWSTPPEAFAGIRPEIVHTIADRTRADISWVQASRNARVYAWAYRAWDAARPVVGVLFLLGAAGAALTRRWGIAMLACMWGANAAALSWLALCGEARYSEPFQAMFAIVAVFGVAMLVSVAKGAWRPSANARSNPTQKAGEGI